MRHLRRVGFLMGVLSLLTGGLASAQAAPATPPAGQPDSHIVVLRDDVADPGAVAQEHANANGLNVSYVYRYALKGYAATIPTPALAAIERDPRVAFISDDRQVEAVAAPPGPSTTTGQSLPTGVNRIDGELSSHYASNSWNVAVADIDTGSGPHSDLNIAGGTNCSTGASFNDGNGHGTHTAGSIGAINNSAGVVGVAPGIPIYSVRVLNNAGSGTWSSVVCGIDWVTGHASSLHIKVANMSLGGSGSDDGNCGKTNNDALHTAICNSTDAGVLYVVAAGNSSTNFSGFVPAAYNEALTVTAMADSNGAPGGTWPADACRTDQEDTPADFTNYTTPGSSDENHTIAAPGVCILSTWKGGGYNTISGTSMATPHVTGTAALCVAKGSCSGSTGNMLSKLRSDAAGRSASYGFTNSPSGNNKYYGYLVYAGGY